jgi:hypothetical protein
VTADPDNPAPTGGETPTYWEARLLAEIRGTDTATQARRVAQELEACAEVYRGAPFPVTASAADESKVEAIRRVAQLARFAARLLTELAEANP